MLKISIDLKFLIAQVRPYFDSTILKRGWRYYKEGLVSRLKIEDDGKLIRADVRGSTRYTVEMDLNAFSSSSCSCPYGFYCKHMAAVLFEVCEQSGENPKQLLGGQVESMKAGSSASQAPRTIQPATEEGSPSDWHRYLEKQYGHYSLYSLFSLEDFFDKVTRAMLPRAKKWPPALRDLYYLHVYLFIMKQVDAMFVKSGYSHYYYREYTGYFMHISNLCEEKLVALFRNFDVLEARRLYPHHLAETAQFLTKHAFSESYESPMNWLFVYRLLWWNLLNEETWIAQERSRLLKALKKAPKRSNYRNTLVMALCHFDVMQGQDEQVLSMFERELWNEDLGEYIAYLQTFDKLEQWDRLIRWLRWLLPKVRHTSSAFVELYLQCWHRVSKNLELDREMGQVMLSLLPQSLHAYGKHLIAQGRYQQWVELCLVGDVSPLDLKSDELKAVEAADLRLLLPLYHQAVEGYIAGKNRDSYKMAVKLLKKLAQHYKKLKEPKRYERYLAHISQKYSRYRALLEEMRKGKLIG